MGAASRFMPPQVLDITESRFSARSVDCFEVLRPCEALADNKSTLPSIDWKDVDRDPVHCREQSILSGRVELGIDDPISVLLLPLFLRFFLVFLDSGVGLFDTSAILL